MPTTTKNLRYPDGAADNDVPLDMQRLAEDVDARLAQGFTSAQIAAMPAGEKWTGRIVRDTTLGIWLWWDGAAWSPYHGASVIKRKIADESVVSSITLQNDDHLFFALAANEEWLFEAVIFFTGLVGGFAPKVAFTWPALAVARWGLTAVDESATSGSVVGDVKMSVVSTSGTSVRFNDYPSGQEGLAIIRGRILNGANAGNLQLQFAQSTADASAATFLTGSHLLGHRVA